MRHAAALLLLAAATPATAQVPPVEALASQWVPVRMCRPHATPLLPCDAGGDLDARTCGDFGCCAMPKGGGPSGAPACYMPNGGSRGSANQTAFGADPWLNDGQAVPALAQPGALLSIDWGADLLGVECFASPPFVGSCKSPGGGLLLPHGGSSFATLSVDGTPSAELATGLESQWMPHQILRNATLWRPDGGTLRARSAVRTVFDRQTILLRLELEPSDAAEAAAPLSVDIDLSALVMLSIPPKTDHGTLWGWDVKRPQSTAGFAASLSADGTMSLTSHSASGAHSAAAFGAGTSSKPALRLSGPGHVTASWAALDPTKPFVAEIILAIGSNATVAESTASALAAGFDRAWGAARDDWQGWWASVFDPSVPTALPFEGQLPTLTTEDEALKRTYYINVVSLLGNARHVKGIPSQAGGPWDDQVVFATGGPVCAVAEMIIWDTTLNSVLLTLLQPTLYKSYLRSWLMSDIHQHLALDMVGNVGEQKWYAFDDMMVYRGLETVGRFLGPEEFATSQLGSRKAWEWMEGIATYWLNLTHGCLTPACLGVAAESSSAVAAGSDGVGACDLAGVWFGCSGPSPTAGGCGRDHDMPMTITTMPAVDGQSVHVDFPAGVAHHWWSVGMGNATAGGQVALSLFMPDGKPYATPPFLRGTESGCDGLVWANTNTSWCRNGSAPWCTSHAAPSIVVDGLADYGTETHLLECVPTYTHKVAALNAANAKMMRSSATIAEGRGDRARAAHLRALASNVSALVRSKLFIGGANGTDGGFFAAEQPTGELVPVRHVIDFISVVTSIAEDLPPAMRRSMMGFVRRELLTTNWMRALSLQDSSLLHPSANSDRKDHGPLGAYDGWPGETIEAFCLLGEYQAALELTRAMATAYDDGPGGQAHQVFEEGGKVLRPPRKAAADQQWYELAGAVAANRVITGLFGVAPPLDFSSRVDGGPALDFLRDAETPRGFNGTLSGVRIRGQLYTVQSGPHGLSARLQGAVGK